jgi:hypothetical protein
MFGTAKGLPTMQKCRIWYASEAAMPLKKTANMLKTVDRYHLGLISNKLTQAG